MVPRLLGLKLGPQHGHCRLTRKADKGKSGVHIDPAAYSGIVHISRPEDCARPEARGTDVFRHRLTELESMPQDAEKIAASGDHDINALIEDVVNKDTMHPVKWERNMCIPARFNRLLVFFGLKS